MNLISEIHDKSSERTVSNAVAGYVVPITALGLSSLFDTMKKKKVKNHEPIVDLEGEIWKDIIGNEGRYQVSNLGRVKSLINNKILKTNLSVDGYTTVTLSIKGKAKTFKVYHLVFEAFNGWRPKGKIQGNSREFLVINHKDENKQNSCLDNLEVISQYQNSHYGNAQFLLKQSHLKNKIYQYSLTGVFIQEWDSARDCGRAGFHTGHISKSCQGIYGRTHDRQVYNGFIWSYKKLTTAQCLHIAQKKCNSRTSNHQRNVYQYDIDGNLLKIWKSESECAKNGYSGNKVSACCYGRQKTHKGYIWSFKPLENKKV